MFILCEKCYPNWKDKEIYTITPSGPCDECGEVDESRGGQKGVVTNAFPSDPRKKDEASI